MERSGLGARTTTETSATARRRRTGRQSRFLVSRWSPSPSCLPTRTVTASPTGTSSRSERTDGTAIPTATAFPMGPRSRPASVRRTPTWTATAYRTPSRLRTVPILSASIPTKTVSMTGLTPSRSIRRDGRRPLPIRTITRLRSSPSPSQRMPSYSHPSSQRLDSTMSNRIFRGRQLNKTRHSLLYRTGAIALTFLQASPTFALGPQEKTSSQPAPVPTPPPMAKVVPNRTAPSVTAPPLLPHFSTPPTDAEIARARAFDEPLLPLPDGRAGTADVALAAAILE